jgi:hypothetical protein
MRLILPYIVRLINTINPATRKSVLRNNSYSCAESIKIESSLYFKKIDLAELDFKEART